MLRTQPAPCRLLRRHRLRRVDPAPDQVEQRRGELVRTGLAAFAKERGHEPRRGVARRFLLVLTVVAGPALTAVEPEDDRDDDEGWSEPEREHVQQVAERVPFELLDAVVVALEGGGVRVLLRNDPPESCAAGNAQAACRREGRPADERAELDPLLRGDVECPQRDHSARELDVTPDVDRVPPGPHDAAGRGEGRRELAEALFPLVAPDVQVDVDDVVISNGESAQAVAQLERAGLVGCAVVPDDARVAVELRHSVGPGCVRTAELRAAARVVRAAAFEHGHVADGLARPQWDLAIPAGETAVEGVLDLLVDEKSAVTGEPHGHARLWKRERLVRRSVRGQRERERGGGE